MPEAREVLTATDEEELFDPNAELEAQMKASSPKPAEDAAPAEVSSQSVINERLATAIEKLAEAQQSGPIKQIPFSKAVIRTPWNPTGTKLRPRLKRITRMNGFRLHEATLNDEVIRLLNKLKAGRYNRGRWVVIESDDNEGAAIDLLVQNKSFEDRLRTKSEAPTLAHLLRKILEEAGIEA